MKHTEWLRLKTEGENMCSTLRQQHYQCRKQTHRLSWKISKEGSSYVLTWLPAPVSDWSVIPNDTNPARETLWNLVQITLKTLRQREVTTYQRTPQPEDFSRPWAIVRLFPDLRRYTVARIYKACPRIPALCLGKTPRLSQRLARTRIKYVGCVNKV